MALAVTFGVGGAVFVAGVAFLLWVPGAPADTDQLLMLRIFTAFRRILSFCQAEWVGRAFLGHTNRFQILRAVSSYALKPMALDAEPDMKVTDDVYGGVQVRVYRPKSAPVPTSAVMHFHGGGWSVGSPYDMDFQSRYVARNAQTVVIAVRYRLAPEHPFPAALDDCLGATVHVLEHGPELGIDVTRVGVAGYSAGGNLAAAVSLRLQGSQFQSLPRLRYQVFYNAAFQGIDFHLPCSYSAEFTYGLLSRDDMAAFIASYAGLDLSPETIRQVALNQHVTPATRARLAEYVHPDLVREELAKLPDAVKKRNAALPTDVGHGPVNETLAAQAEPVITSPFFSPLFADDAALQRMPPALLLLAQHDVLRDDSLLFARRLRAAGASVTSLLVKTGHHVSLALGRPEPGSEVAKDMYRKVIDFMKDAIEN